MTAAPKPAAPAVLTVSQLTAQVRGTIEAKFLSVWVAGEVSNFTRASSGHWYFTLKDATAQIKTVAFRGINLRLRFDPRDGMEVIARGRLTVYDPRGEYQFIVEELQPKGVGAAELALRQLKEKLLAKGYFDPKRKRPLPRPPRRVALVASATGAAVRDMIEVFAQRWPFTELVVRPARVQGEGAAQDISLAVRQLNWLHRNNKLAFDAIVLGRGGGSAEDLWAFNEELVADAIYNSQVPVVSAVGHEIDVTVADLVADHRAETPTAAVVALTPDRRELVAALGALRGRMAEAAERRLKSARQRLDQFATRPAFRRPLQRVHDLEQRLDDTAARLARAARVRLSQATQKLAEVSARLETLSPLQVLARGYSLTHTTDGRLVRDPRGLRPGDLLVTRVTAGVIRSLVTEARSTEDDPPPQGAG
ncbi:exodeoxyribonuclease VII large subunit [Frigoriglobus tundricola]|uniref:Exodeoxyribonuclease 7 large subunit n=1 Tax=Frigoriglobus tundricola TaxID=2774151 RepID=A0A6M5YUJ2_9BACT|nr:exodeoxyribonuclease VII large subunit [Frigoriglobus tundricola]QJW96921.1 Exodeoxyribonuclease VII large subunit [Frigoriglobus tundricola]